MNMKYYLDTLKLFGKNESHAFFVQIFKDRYVLLFINCFYLSACVYSIYFYQKIHLLLLVSLHEMSLLFINIIMYAISFLTTGYLIKCLVSYSVMRGLTVFSDQLAKIVTYPKKTMILAKLFITILQLKLMAQAFCFFKQMIPDINPFYFDTTLAHIDSVLFFHHSPWQLIPQYHWLTKAIDVVYGYGWGLSQVCIVFYMGLTHNEFHRNRFIINFLGSWLILGLVLATICASLGPCFYHLFYHQDISHYDQLLGYLKSFDKPLTAVNVQHMLWSGYLHRNTDIFFGISAFPSLHVGMCYLFHLTFRSIDKKCQWLTLPFLFLIWVGSIHLGWHYAIDGLVVIPCVHLIWLLSKPLAKRMQYATCD